MKKDEIIKLNIYEFDNYRTFLEALYKAHKESTAGFSFRAFSQRAGFSSPNFLKLVIEGKRNLTASSIDKFAAAFKLNKDETSFFRNLVLLNQAVTSEEKKFYAWQIIHTREYKKAYPLKQAQYDYYAKWYYVPIREIVGLSDFKEDPAWIARQLVPPVTAAEVEKALRELEALGLIRRNAEGKLEQCDSVVATSDEVSSAFVAQFHKEMIRKGAESIDRVNPLEREISALTLRISKKTAGEMKKLIQRFKGELMTLASQDASPEEVYQVNFQLFPLTRKKVKKRKPKEG